MFDKRRAPGSSTSVDLLLREIAPFPVTVGSNPSTVSPRAARASSTLATAAFTSGLLRRAALIKARSLASPYRSHHPMSATEPGAADSSPRSVAGTSSLGR